ncbi:MAG: ATP-binding cassette domain-containing protein [Bacteroidales bacterium]|jgi:ABC-2 type transport system ATP-binding protein|nr:ATP-binding cassette domain-containing protein [Bacteroidales bacterium]MDD4671877.1 ATP-binding cassette domain-containing protein [Bacteroidales bacterium]MDY0349161.1 ATP-binding cassette domain-containing protein [Tenuifilaceae bacterium]
MIQLSNITFGYRKKQILFDNLNLTLEFGKIYGLFGVNGAGKTTLLKQLSGLLKPTEGKITINGLHVGTRDANALETVFLVPEEFELPPISTRRFIELNAPFYKGFDHSLFETSMVEFELGLDENLAAMSYGQKKKFLVSFGLATQTPLLLLDEPTNGLDIPSKSQFRKIMAKIASDDRCIVISTHQVRDLASMIDHAVMVDKGTIVFDHSYRAITEHLTFKHVTGDVPNDAIYAESHASGYNVICKSTKDESEVDLEILFNGVIKDANSINQAIKNA